MIAQLKGTLIIKSPDFVVLDVQGVGYGIFVTLNTFYELPELGAQTKLFTYTHVREDTLQLYGFLTYEEKTLFEQLIGISKVGPKLARNVLSKLSVEELKSAILQADATRIYAIPGVGEKTAFRLILELKDKIAKSAASESGYKNIAQDINEAPVFSDIVSALINLGYSKRDAQKAVRACLSAGTSNRSSVKDIIKSSLEILSR